MSSVRHRTDARTADLLFLTGPIQGPDWRWGPWEGGSCDGQRCLADCGALDSDTEVRCLVWASGARVCARVIVRRAGRDGKRLTTALHCCCSGKALTLSWYRSRRTVRCDGSGLRWRFHTGAIAQLVAQIHGARTCRARAICRSVERCPAGGGGTACRARHPSAAGRSAGPVRCSGQLQETDRVVLHLWHNQRSDARSQTSVRSL
jgi:hypothetical protein